MRLAPHRNASQADKNFFYLVADVFWFGIAAAATSRFLSVYAIRLDASPLAQSLIVSLPGLVIGISTVLAGWWRNRFQNTNTSLWWPGFGFRLIFLLPMFAPFFPADLQVIWLVLAVTIPALPQSISGVIFLTFMRESVGDTLWGAINTRRFLWLNIGIAIGALVFGGMLTWIPFPLNYQMMFVLAFGLSMVSFHYVNITQSVYPTPQPELTAEQMTPLHKMPGFRRVMVSIVLAYLAFLSVNAVIPLALVEHFGADEGFVAIFGMVELFGGVTFGLYGTRFAARWGSRRMTAIMLAITAFTPFILVTTTSLPVTLIGAAATGLGWTGTVNGLLSMLLESSPSYAMPRASARYNQVVAAGTFIGPLIGGLLTNSGMSIMLVLMLGVTLRLGAAMLLSIDFNILRPTWYRLTHPKLAFVSLLR